MVAGYRDLREDDERLRFLHRRQRFGRSRDHTRFVILSHRRFCIRNAPLETPVDRLSMDRARFRLTIFTRVRWARGRHVQSSSLVDLESTLTMTRPTLCGCKPASPLASHSPILEPGLVDIDPTSFSEYVILSIIPLFFSSHPRILRN
jgi:hypothetical protein